MNKWLAVTPGANNNFDFYPSRQKDYINTSDGVYIYGMDTTPFGFNGRYYFVSMEFKW